MDLAGVVGTSIRGRDGAGSILGACTIGAIEMSCRLHEVVALGEDHLKRDTDTTAGIVLNVGLPH